MRVVLVEPLIPQNTGSVGRLCAATQTELVLVEPLGFSLDDRYLKRAGLDYWPWIPLRRVKSLDEAIEGPGTAWFFSGRVDRSYTSVQFGPDDKLVLGKETTGLGPDILDKYADYSLKIPMVCPHVRSLNLAQSAAIVLMEARRQLGLT